MQTSRELFGPVIWILFWGILLAGSAALAAGARHSSGGQVGPNGVKERAAFKILKSKEGKDKLLLSIDLSDHAFSSKVPEELKDKRLRITLGREAFEADTDDRARIRGDHVRMNLISNGKGMRIVVRKSTFDDLKSQIPSDENHLDALLSVFVAGPASGDGGGHDDGTHAHSKPARDHPGDGPDTGDISSGFGPEDESTPPTVTITQPSEGAKIQEDHVTVKYLITGQHHDVDHACIQLDDESPIGKHDPIGEYTFHGLANGVHVVKVQLKDAEGRNLTNVEASAEATFVVEPYGSHNDGGEMLYQRNLGFELLQSSKRVIGRE